MVCMFTYMNMKVKIHLQQLFWISQAKLISKEHINILNHSPIWAQLILVQCFGPPPGGVIPQRIRDSCAPAASMMSIVLLHYLLWAVNSGETWSKTASLILYTLPCCLNNVSFYNSSDVRKNYCRFYFLRVDKFPWSSQCFGWWRNVTLLVIQWREIQFTMGCFL